MKDVRNVSDLADYGKSKPTGSRFLSRFENESTEVCRESTASRYSRFSRLA